MIDALKEKPPPNSVVLSFDEKGKTPVKKFGGRKWCYGKHYRVPYNQKVKALFDLFMVKNIHTGERHHQFYAWKNSFIVVDFFEWLLNDVYIKENVFMILDGWSAHRSNFTLAYADLNPRLHLIPLPNCSSWMNPVERDFSRIQREVLDNSSFESPRQGMELMNMFIKKELNSTKQRT